MQICQCRTAGLSLHHQCPGWAITGNRIETITSWWPRISHSTGRSDIRSRRKLTTNKVPWLSTWPVR